MILLPAAEDGVGEARQCGFSLQMTTAAKFGVNDLHEADAPGDAEVEMVRA